jgi:6-phosphogluconolactonase (cycloisomerase 2 family)
MPISPSCLAVNADGTRLYSANETEKLGEGASGSVSAFAVDRANGSLTLLNTVSSGEAGATYVSLHPSGKFVMVANYHGSAAAIFPIKGDGSLAPASDVKKNAEKLGPTKARNAPPGSFAFSGHDYPHAHMIEADASGRYVFTPFLGIDKILIWKFDAQNGKLTPNDPPAVSFPPGDGPRHFAFHPKKPWFYSLQEEGSNIVLFDYDPSKGTLTPGQTISSLPPGFAGSNFCSEILVSPDGRFVYAGNRLHDGIACFAIGEDGTLKFVSEEWTRGDYPRSFNFDPSGQFLYSCNQRADNVTAFRINRETGALSFTGQYTPVGNPSMITFLDLAKS